LTNNRHSRSASRIDVCDPAKRKAFSTASTRSAPRQNRRPLLIVEYDNPWFTPELEEERQLDLKLYPERYVAGDVERARNRRRSGGHRQHYSADHDGDGHPEDLDELATLVEESSRTPGEPDGVRRVQLKEAVTTAFDHVRSLLSRS
jgi:hypothetical protein